jgi:phospholipase/lecithinase/hemolysin
MKKLFFLSVSLALFTTASAFALDFSKFNHLVIFGDSLSDNGNSLVLFGQPLYPYGQTFDGSPRQNFPGRYTDGRNWVDYFPSVAKHFDSITSFFPVPPETKAGTNFAIGGSTSAILLQSEPGFPAQIPSYLGTKPGRRVPLDDLCVIWIGANDFAAGVAPQQTVANIRRGISTLARAGAEHFIVVDVPDISQTPVVKAAGAAQKAREFVAAVNVLLAIEVPLSAWLERVSINLVDINAIFIPIVLNPFFFGFSNSVGAAFDPGPPARLASAPDQYVFWDEFHPTTRVHRLAAQFIYQDASSKFDFSVLSSR